MRTQWVADRRRSHGVESFRESLRDIKLMNEILN